MIGTHQANQLQTCFHNKMLQEQLALTLALTLALALRIQTLEPKSQKDKYHGSIAFIRHRGQSSEYTARVHVDLRVLGDKH